MNERKKLYALIGLLAVLLLVYSWEHSSPSTFSGVLASDTKFQPLPVQDPQLRLDLLQKIHNSAYSGTHRNIFNATPPPPEPTPEEKKKLEEAQKTAAPSPAIDTGPPPLVISATFFGYATDERTGHRLAFFQSGDDVFVLGEGGVLLDRYRLLKIGNDSAEFEEISTQRHASLPITQPVDQGSGSGAGPQPQG